MNDEGKHITKLSATDRARATQIVQESLLAIVATQTGGTVTIPISILNDIAVSHRLKIEAEGGTITLTAEKAELIIRAH